MRLGMGMEVEILAKSTRSRYTFFEAVYISASLQGRGPPRGPHARKRANAREERHLSPNARTLELSGRPRPRRYTAPGRYLISTVAPTSSNFFLIAAASSLDTPSFTTLGAPSTRSLASLRPRLVTSRTTLITLIFLSPALVR